MKDPIDRFLEKYSPSYMPVENEERKDSSPPATKPQEPELTEQERWDNAVRSMGWTYLVGMKKDELEWTYEDLVDDIKARLHKEFHKKP